MSQPAGTDEPQNLEALLSEIETDCAGQEKVKVGDIQEAIGGRSFGPLLLILGLMALTPIGGIPGVPTILALMVVLVAVQMAVGRQHFWLPKFLREREVSGEKLRKSINSVRKPARFVDRFIKPRLKALTGEAADRVAAVVCVLIAVAIPPLELLPFAVAAPALAIAAFGLGFTAKDGALVAFAFVASTVTLALTGVALLR